MGPLFSVPWLWLADRLAPLLPLGRDGLRLVDGETGATLREWVCVPPFELGSGNAAAVHLTVDADGRRHELHVGTVGYGRVQQPPGGHEPPPIIDGEGLVREAERSALTQGGAQRLGDSRADAAAMAELTRIWHRSSGSAVEELPAGMLVWHCGCIPSASDLDDAKALWTAREAAAAADYEGTARENSRWSKHPPTKLEFELRRPLKAADFASQSLRPFTQQYCNCNHDSMKAILRKWMLAEGFDAIVRLNSDPTEVVVARPAADLVVRVAVPL